MTQALILRDRSVCLTDAERAAAQKALQQGLRGVDDINHKRWLRFLHNMFSLQHGEIAEIGTRIPRSGAFHRFHMSIEQAVFDAQDRFDDFDQFRNWIKISCGLVTWVPGAKGGIVPLPKSISYASMEEGEMREFHDNMIKFFHGSHCAPYLWPHLGGAGAAEMMKAVLTQFEMPR